MANTTKKSNPGRENNYYFRNVGIILLLFFALALGFEQFLNWGVFFEFSDLHHETFMIAFVFGAVLIIFFTSKYAKK